MAQHSSSAIVPTESKPGFIELTRLSDEAYEQLMTSLVDAGPAAAMPELSVEVESRLETFIANPDELFVTLLSLYVFRERAARNEADPAKVLAESIIKGTGCRNMARGGDVRRLADRLRVLLPIDKDADITNEAQNTDPPGLGKNHPMAHIVGRYEDGPHIDAYLAEIKKYRDEVTERDIAELELAERE